MHVDLSSIHPSVHEAATLPFSLGGLGIRSAFRSRQSAHWASWADCLAMVKARHPTVAARIVGELGRLTPVACLGDVQVCALALGAVGIELPSWSSLADGARPVLARGDVQDQPHCGWQREVSLKVEQHFRDTRLLPTMTEPDQALLRSQGGPLAAAPFTSCPTDRLFRIEPQCFRVLLLRRLRLPLPLSQRICRCGRPLDVLGHHHAACAVAGVLGRRGFAVESVVARICREGGARVTANMFVRDMDLRDFDRLDGRRLEVVADGLPLFGGAQLAIDATLVSAIKRDGTARAGAATTDGAALSAARRRKVRTYPELSGDGGRCRLVVLGGEVAGRWSSETRQFLTALSRAKSRSAPEVLRKSAETAWRRRWGNMLGCCAAWVVAESLLGGKGAPGADGESPSVHEVVCDHRHA